MPAERDDDIFVIERKSSGLGRTKARYGATIASGPGRIVAERIRQVEEEGYGAVHDAEHDKGELIRAAIAYAMEGMRPSGRINDVPAEVVWPWVSYFKPSEDPIRNLEKAGALIAAEIDRLLAEPRGSLCHGCGQRIDERDVVEVAFPGGDLAGRYHWGDRESADRMLELLSDLGRRVTLSLCGKVDAP